MSTDFNIKPVGAPVAAPIVQPISEAAHNAVATELPSHITDEQSAAGIQKFYEGYAIPADSFARAVGFAIEQPADVDINEILFRPTRQEL